MIRKAGAFIMAVLVAYCLAAVAATQSVLARVNDMGLSVGLGQRLATTGQDLLGMATAFAPMIAVGFALAFAVTVLLLRWWPERRTALYVLAGAVSLIAVHVIMKAVFDITPVAAARSLGGLVIQGLAGAFGGYAFTRFNPQRRA